MLVIRHPQMAALARSATERFVDRAVAHLYQVVPDDCADLGDEAVRASVDRAISRARSYGIVDESDVLQYLNLMYAVGFDFDVDPLMPWAAELLGDKDFEPSAKIELLWDRLQTEAGEEDDSVG